VIPVGVPDVTQVKGSAVAVEEWPLGDLDLADTDVQPTSSEHAMATRLGENAFLVRQERFLLAHQARWRRYLGRRVGRDPP
jgi:hypothetical protein